MTKYVYALGPDGYGPHLFDSESFSLAPANEHGELPLLVPGFVDIHCHGAFGIDFMSASPSDMALWCERLTDVGYEGFLPTTVTASVPDVRRALSVIPEHPMVWGFHLEGPFISKKYPGAQPQEFITLPPAEVSEWDPILDDPRLKVITLAPEIDGALALTARLASRGVKVSLGHTNATYAECEAALAAGARHTTHTYNAMRPLHHREPGTVGFAMTKDSVFAELIYDRHHVVKPAADVLVRSKPADRLIAISDATMAAGLPPGTKVTMWGLHCVVGDGEVRLLDGTLAGSAITLLDAFRNLNEDFGPETAIRACSWNPRLALGRDPFAPATYVELDPAGNILHRYTRR